MLWPYNPRTGKRERSSELDGKALTLFGEKIKFKQFAGGDWGWPKWRCGNIYLEWLATEWRAFYLLKIESSMYESIGKHSPGLHFHSPINAKTPQGALTALGIRIREFEDAGVELPLK